MSLLSSPTVLLKLTEPFVFVTAPRLGHVHRDGDTGPTGPVLVRGLLILKVPKSAKITGIDVVLSGQSVTDWPEGIGPRRIEVAEAIPLLELSTSFLQESSAHRRALSLGPGIIYDDHDLPSFNVLQSRPLGISSTSHQNHPAELGSTRDDSGSWMPGRSARAASLLPMSDRAPHPPTLSLLSPTHLGDEQTPPYSPDLAFQSRNPALLQNIPGSPSPDDSPDRSSGHGESGSSSSWVEVDDHIPSPSTPEPSTVFARRSFTTSHTPGDGGATPVPAHAMSQSSHPLDSRNNPSRSPDTPLDRLGLSTSELLTDVVDPDDHPISTIPEDSEATAPSNNELPPSITTPDQEDERDGIANVSLQATSGSITASSSSAASSGHDISVPNGGVPVQQQLQLPNAPVHPSPLVNTLQIGDSPSLSRQSSARSAPELTGSAPLAESTPQRPLLALNTHTSLYTTSSTSTPLQSPSPAPRPELHRVRTASSSNSSLPSPQIPSSGTSQLNPLSRNPSNEAPPALEVSTTPERSLSRGRTPIATSPNAAANLQASSSGNRSASASRHRFSFAAGFGAVSNMLREVGHEVKEVVGSSLYNPTADRASHARTSSGSGVVGPTPILGLSPGRGGSGSRSRAGRGRERDRSRDGSRDETATAREPSLTPREDGFMRSFGRGGRGQFAVTQSQALERPDGSASRSRTRADGRAPNGRASTDDRPGRTERHDFAYGDHLDGELVERRGRDATINPLGERTDEDEKSKAGWKEFHKGTYTYPISFAIPPNLPPSLACDFGNVSYKLKATVHRAGTFAPKLTAMAAVQLVSCLPPESTDDLDNIIVERQWEDQLGYMVHIEGTAFPVGGIVPINLTLIPLDKISIHRISIDVEERIDYFAHGHKVVRHDPTRRYELAQVRPTAKEDRLLPIISDSPDAGKDSPLIEYIHPDERDNTFPSIPPTASTATLDHTSDMVSHILSPSGPWRLRFDAQLPNCSSTMRFTNKHPGARIVVQHRLKTTIRVSKGVLDPKSDKKPKMFDIIVETPIHILACQCGPAFTHLPTYSQLAEMGASASTPSPQRRSEVSNAGPARHQSPQPQQKVRQTGSYTRRTNAPVLVPGFGPNPAAAARAGPSEHGSAHVGSVSYAPVVADDASSSGPAADSEAVAVSEQFARLIAGQESEAGDQPPAYSSLR